MRAYFSTSNRARSATKRLAVVATLALALGACGHADPAPTASSSGSTEPAQTSQEAVGSFGTLENVCGPGEPESSDARGVTDSTIEIGVQNDATNTLQPGLGEVYLTIAEAFADWCNDAGGINGRQIEIVNRDGQITQAAATVVDACQSDFMLVGGGTPFDAPTVDPRVGCELGSIPAYAASPVANRAELQALPLRVSPEESNVGLYRLLQDEYADEFEKTGMLAIDVESLLLPYEATRDGIDQSGLGNVVSFQKLPLTVDEYRTYVEPLVDKVDNLVPSPADNTNLFQAMVDVGYEPAVMTGAANLYSPATIESLKATGLDVPFYLGMPTFPLELADQNPTVQKMIELEKQVDPDAEINSSAWAAWLLFAQSATECGDGLTVDCVISKATKDTKYTAGGILAPVDLSNPTAATPCVAVMSVDANGFAYEEDLTQPTDSIFNCDPDNVINLEG